MSSGGVPLVRLGFDLFTLVGNGWMVNLRPGGALRWKVEDHWLGRTGRVLWKVSTSKVVAPICIG
jgi:hypothetical protein